MVVKYLIILSILGGCANLSKEDCQSQDWSQYSKNRFLNYQQSFKNIWEHANKSCSEHGVTPNLEAMKQGYVAGVNQHCNSKNVWDKGIAGSEVNLNHCPNALKSKLEKVSLAATSTHKLETLEKGLIEKQNNTVNLISQRYEIEKEINQLIRTQAPQTQIDLARDRLNRKQTEIISNQNDISKSQLEIAQLKRRINAYMRYVN